MLEGCDSNAVLLFGESEDPQCLCNLCLWSSFLLLKATSSHCFSTFKLKEIPFDKIIIFLDKKNLMASLLLDFKVMIKISFSK